MTDIDSTGPRRRGRPPSKDGPRSSTERSRKARALAAGKPWPPVDNGEPAANDCDAHGPSMASVARHETEAKAAGRSVAAELKSCPNHCHAVHLAYIAGRRSVGQRPHTAH